MKMIMIPMMVIPIVVTVIANDITLIYNGITVTISLYVGMPAAAAAEEQKVRRINHAKRGEGVWGQRAVLGGEDSGAVSSK